MHHDSVSSGCRSGGALVVLLLAFAGLDGDHVGADRADAQRGGDPGDDVAVAGVAVQQQHLDQRAGAAGVAVGVRGPRPRTPRGRR